MKSKIVTTCTVFLITLVVLSPGLLIFEIVWQKHLELVRYQPKVHEINYIFTDEPTSLGLQADNSSSDVNFCNALPNNPKFAQDITGTKIETPQQKAKSCNRWRTLLFFVPFSIGIATFLYDRYLVYRANMFQKQVEMLERLWQRVEQ